MPDQYKLRRFVTWLRKHSESLLALAVGIAVGIGCRYPTGWALPDNTAAMFAAVISALATASAVVLGVDLQRATDEAKGKARQANVRARVRVMLLALFSQAGIAYRGLDKSEIRTAASRNLVTDTQRTIEQLRTATGVREELDYEGSLLLTYIELHLESFLLTAEITVSLMRKIELAPESLAETMEEARLGLAKATNDLIDQVNEFSPDGELEGWKLPT